MTKKDDDTFEDMLNRLFDKKLIGKRLKALREVNNLTQEYIAFNIGISQTGYCKIESGNSNVSIKALRTILALHNIKISDFLSAKLTLSV